MDKKQEPFRMSKSLASIFSLAAIGCGSSSPAQNDASQSLAADSPSVASLRAQGPEGLAIALAEYDGLAPGEAKEQQAAIVDAVAAQRYATSSRLYWFTDLSEARADAERSGRPILSLRLLGRLDEDYSCANSRMFRTVLYANQEVSSYLRDNFTLHWSSEREVPKLTVDFGGGRVMKSTIAGNSAHYILDSAGRPIDVIPGLYSPRAFVEALEPGRRLAIALESSKTRSEDLLAYHQGQLDREVARFATLPAGQRVALNPYRSKHSNKELLMAESFTVSKAMIEVPVARKMAAEPEATPSPRAVRDAVTDVEALDASSQKLIISMGPTNWAATPEQLEGQAVADLFAELAARVAGDTLINRHGLRPLIHQLFVDEPLQSFDKLNATIYSEIFVTPQSDPWLGMAQPEGFTGLPGDGLTTKP
jgi:hypothetical protein